MPEVYQTIFQEGRDEFIVSRSRFIGCSKPASAEEEALAFIEKLRKNHWDASHNVWAYRLGASKERYSDDGEPQGTAGPPVLDVIRKEGLRDVVVVVTRYFGGIKLGAGGLVRAYTRGAQIALEAGLIIQQRPYLSFSISMEYAQAGKFQRVSGSRGYLIKEAAWLERVTFIVLIPPEEKDALYALTAEITSGRGLILAGGVEYLGFRRGKMIR